MLHHRTDDIAKRAAAIADQEADEIYRKTGSFIQFQIEWDRVYNEAIKEFSS